MIRTIIVDDHRLFSDGLATALEAIIDIAVVATFESGDAFLEADPLPDHDVLLLDLEMPGVSGIEVLERTKNQVPAIIVSMHTGPSERDQALAEGAFGFLSKSTPLLDLAAAIRAVASGQRLADNPATLRGILDEFLSATLDPGAASLTQRERELLGWLARGVTATDELADKLFISQKTVKNHLASIYEKLAVSDRAQAAVEAIRLGIWSK